MKTCCFINMDEKFETNSKVRSTLIKLFKFMTKDESVCFIISDDKFNGECLEILCELQYKNQDKYFLKFLNVDFKPTEFINKYDISCIYSYKYGLPSYKTLYIMRYADAKQKENYIIRR